MAQGAAQGPRDVIGVELLPRQQRLVLAQVRGRDLTARFNDLALDLDDEAVGAAAQHKVFAAARVTGTSRTVGIIP